MTISPGLYTPADHARGVPDVAVVAFTLPPPPPPAGGNTIVEAVVSTPVCAPVATDTFTVPAVVATEPDALPSRPARPEAPVKVCPPIVSLDTARLPPFRLPADILY